MKQFKLIADYQPSGDQGDAIRQLADGILAGDRFQTLKGVTGSGKTFTMANIIQAVQKPTLIISHNKTLAAQLYREFKGFFPENAVEYFVSYYDYYQPEAYVPARDLYIEKDAAINDEIDRLRLSATFSLMERRDVIVVSTVSCIYGLGLPESWRDLRITIEKGQTVDPGKLKKQLISLQYERNDAVLERGRFRVKGDVMEIFPAYMEEAYRIEFDWEEIVRIRRFNPLTGEVSQEYEELSIYPAKHFVMPENAIPNAIERIKQELDARLETLKAQGKLFEAERLKTRTEYDIEMLSEMGHCPGIENYSAPIANRKPGEPPATLFHYFPKDFLLFMDESHVTFPQIGAMYEGDRSRKQNLVDFGFRLPCALDNRPLRFEEFEALAPQTIYISATPGDYEREHSGQTVEQVVRPTGLLDPEVEIRPVDSQVEDILGEIRERVAAELVTRCAGFDCTVEDISLRTCLIAVQGPRAQEVLVGVVESGAAMPGALRPLEGSEEEDCGPDVLCGPTLLERLRFYAAVRATAAGHSVLLARTGYTGEDGFELFCGAEDAVDLWTVITSAAAALEPTVIDGEPVPALTPCGLAARDSLRLEAGMPLYGHELHEGMTPYDAGLGMVVRLNKGDFIGRDALAARAEQEGTEGTSVLVPLTAEGRRAARAGAPVLGDDGEVLGTVTSGLLSPTLGHPVALALLRPWSEDAPAWPVGTVLVADVRGRPLEVTVVDSPFYKRTR